MKLTIDLQTKYFKEIGIKFQRDKGKLIEILMKIF